MQVATDLLKMTEKTSLELEHSMVKTKVIYLLSICFWLFAVTFLLFTFIILCLLIETVLGYGNRLRM